MRTHDDIENELNETIGIIFSDEDIMNLSSYEIRQKIFNYLTHSLSYDYEALEKIKSTAEGGKRFTRNAQVEFQNVVFNKIGICNAISQFYKLLLEKVGIKSYCVICDDGTSVGHQLNLVYDDANDCYSFDDVTSVIVGRGSEQDYFDYDLESAHLFGQGNRNILNDEYYLFLWEDYINFVVMRNENRYKTISKMPTNVRSVKSILQHCVSD